MSDFSLSAKIKKRERLRTIPSPCASTSSRGKSTIYFAAIRATCSGKETVRLPCMLSDNSTWKIARFHRTILIHCFVMRKSTRCETETLLPGIIGSCVFWRHMSMPWKKSDMAPGSTSSMACPKVWNSWHMLLNGSKEGFCAAWSAGRFGSRCRILGKSNRVVCPLVLSALGKKTKTRTMAS